MRGPKPSELRSPQDALRAYLDEMLHLATALRPADTDAEPDREESDARAPARDSRTGAAVEIVAPPRPVADTGAAPVAAASTPVVVEPAAVQAAATSAADRFRFPLQCLMFRVGGHLLALPLIELAGVIEAGTRLTRLPQLPIEVLGLLQHRERTLRVVDSGALLGLGEGSDATHGHLLLLAAGDWALTCDAPEQVIYLARDDVQWRAAGDRLLRYGTIRESLATLLAPEAICQWLERRVGA